MNRLRRRICRPVRTDTRLNHLHGLTLIELTVVLAVGSVLVATAWPSLQDILNRQRMVSAVNTLISALHLARSEAIRRGGRVSLCPSRDGEACTGAGTDPAAWHHGYLLYHNSNGDQERDADEPVLRHFDAIGQLHIFTPRSRDNITYHPTGLSPGSNATFLVCDPVGRIPARHVVLSNSGRPRVESATEPCPQSPG